MFFQLLSKSTKAQSERATAGSDAFKALPTQIAPMQSQQSYLQIKAPTQGRSSSTYSFSCKLMTQAQKLSLIQGSNFKKANLQLLLQHKIKAPT
jgi:hypothetical protein